MKQQMTMMEMAKELTRQQEERRDLIVDTREMEVALAEDGGPGTIRVEGGVGEEYELAEYAHRQLAQRLRIPVRHYDRMRSDHPDLLELQVNELLHREPERRMVRTLDGTARAILSDRYKRLDNDGVVEAVWPAFLDAGAELDLEQSAFYLSEERFEMKIVLPQVAGEVREGDVVTQALHITNSEVGSGRLRVDPMLYRLVCTNGMIAPESIAGARIARNHVGARHGALGVLAGEASSRAYDHAFWVEVREVAEAAMERGRFEELLGAMREATGRPIGSPTRAVEELGRSFKLSEGESSSVLDHLGRGGDMTAYGLLNAVTRAAQDVGDVHRSSELEAIGGRILAMPPRDWARLAA